MCDPLSSPKKPAKMLLVSIAQETADKSGIEHRFCGPTQEQRDAIGYRDGQSRELEIFMQDEDGLSNDEIMLKDRAIEIGRYSPICGDAHIDSFGRLLDSNRIEYRIVGHGIGLAEEGRLFESAVQYVKNHPELMDG